MLKILNEKKLRLLKLFWMKTNILKYKGYA